METLKKGSLAYLDSFAGLVPCKVLDIKGKSGMANSSQEVEFQLTAKRGAYKQGEVLKENALHVVPRKAVFGKYKNRIHAYQVECE